MMTDLSNPEVSLSDTMGLLHTTVGIENISRRGIVREGARVRVLDTRKDAAERVWLKVLTPVGRTG